MPMFDIKRIDKGWNKILEELAKANKAHVDCGMLADSGKEENGFDLVRLAAIQEFGHDKLKIPSRPAHRDTFDQNLDKINRYLNRQYDNILKGKTDTYTALNLLGNWYVGQIKSKITKGPWTANAPSTLRANWRKHHKGAITKSEALQNESGIGTSIKKPLIDTSVMRNSIAYIVVKK